jgi:hypothetical protein
MIVKFIREVLFVLYKNPEKTKWKAQELRLEIQEADQDRALGVATDMSRGSLRRHLEDHQNS